MTTASQTQSPGGARVAVQRFGTFLSGMIMPNIAAFIAWGLITTLFIATGWLGFWHPVADMFGGFGDQSLIGWMGSRTQLAVDDNGNTFQQYVGLVGPMITYLLPLLIANTAGRMVHGDRGGVVATIATMGVIVGTDIPMFLGAMVMGPFAGWLTKKMDQLWEGKIRPGFEMLVNNYSAGILGFLLSILGFFVFGPVMQLISNALGAVVNWMVSLHILPVLSVIVEPAKVLFLNNAINHGVFTPLATQQVAEQGKSFLYLIEANPGPGLGILLAFTFFGVGAAKSSAPGAIIIQFLGGIHEIYFPYVLMKPMVILAAIAGGATGVATNVLFNSGLVAPAAPGSIFAVLAATSKDSYLGVILSIFLAATVSFLIASIILRASRKRDLENENAGDLSAAIAATQANKGKESSVLGGLAGAPAATSTAAPARHLQNIVFACDAGMGSSAMGASVLRNKFKKAGVEGITVTNKAIANLDGSEDLVITQQQLTQRASDKNPTAVHVSVDNFMNSPKYDEVVDLVRKQQEAGQ